MTFAGEIDISGFEVALVVLASAVSIVVLPGVVIAIFLLWRRRRRTGVPDPILVWFAEHRALLMVLVVVIALLAVVIGLTQSGITLDFNGR